MQLLQEQGGVEKTNDSIYKPPTNKNKEKNKEKKPRITHRQ